MPNSEMKTLLSVDTVVVVLQFGYTQYFTVFLYGYFDVKISIRLRQVLFLYNKCLVSVQIINLKDILSLSSNTVN